MREHRDAIMLSECTWQAKRGIRTREWKYICCWDPGIYPRVGPELYDLQADPLEQDNVAAEQPEVVRDLQRRLQTWVDERLGARADPIAQVLEFGLPAVQRLEGVIAEDAASALRIELGQMDQPHTNGRQPSSILARRTE
jgi:arylsulfatase A-like enzyme